MTSSLQGNPIEALDGSSHFLASPRTSRNLHHGPMSVATSNSNQMDRFLKSSVLQQHRNPMVRNVFEKHQNSFDSSVGGGANSSAQQITGSFGGQHRRLQSLVVTTNSPRVQFHHRHVIEPNRQDVPNTARGVQQSLFSSGQFEPIEVTKVPMSNQTGRTVKR